MSMRFLNCGKRIGIVAPLLASAVFFIYSSVSAGVPGTSAASFLKFTPGPRATAMGESYTSVTADAYAAYWNPAGLASVELAELAVTYNSSFEDVSHQYISLAYPLSFGSTLDFNVTRLAVTPFQGYDAVGSRTGKIQSSDLAIGAAYGRTLIKDEVSRPVFNVGVNLKSVTETLNKVSANTFAADLGAIYYLRPAKYWRLAARGQEFRFALTARNLGPGLRFDKLTSTLPMSATLGSSWLSHPYGSSTLILSLDQTAAKDDKYSVNLGAEYEVFQLLAFRTGYRSGQAIGSGLRFGFGFKLSFVDLDYSMSPFGDLGSMHKLGLTIKFGNYSARPQLAGKNLRVEKALLITTKEKIEELHKYANDFLELAKNDLGKGRYVSASANLNKAFNLESELKDGEWGKKEGRLAAVISGLRLKDTPGLEAAFAGNSEQARVAHESIMAYVDGSDLKAFLLAHAAWGADIRGEAVFETLLQTLSQLTRSNIRRDETLPRTALVKEKLRKAAGHFYEKRFDLAANNCEEALLLDEGNTIGWTRLGSSYFMLGDKAKAKSAYARALELNPGDEVTMKFMESQGWK